MIEVSAPRLVATPSNGITDLSRWTVFRAKDRA